ncbi:hypothetical protein ACQPUY_15695 [Clostridium nigeriense]|uniref:hypothetical protein n=1 Tax=Clostridium nigeriense TaxID=1805470 RepID=UPI003D34A8AD
MARGRKKQEVEVGYVKERFIVDLILSEEELAKINEIGKTKYISDLVKKDFNTSKMEDTSYNLTVTDEIREKFNNDPRRAYLLGQLLTEFYCNIKSEPVQIVNNNIETKVSTTNKVENDEKIRDEEISIEKDIEIEEENIEEELEESIKDDFESYTERVSFNDRQEQIEEIAVSKETPEKEEQNPIQSDGRIGRLNTAPLIKKRLGSKK